MRDEILYERKKLPVWAVVKRSYGYVWQQRRLLATPLLLVLAAQIVLGLISFGISAATAPLSLAHILFNLGAGLVTMILLMSFTVGLHRSVLLDEIREGASFLRRDRYLWNYVKACLIALLVGIVLEAVFAAALILPLGIGNFMMLFMLHPLAVYALGVLMWLAGLCVAVRLGLAFPAAALGYRSVFSLAWRISAHNGLRLLATLLLADLPFLLSAGLLTAASALSGNLVVMLCVALLDLLLGAATISVIAVALSLNFFFLFQASDLFGAA